MSVNYSASLKTTRMTDVVTAIGGAGKLEIGTAGMAMVLATINLNATPGTVSGPVLTFSGFPKSATAANTGTAAEARIRTGANVDVVTGLSVGMSSADLLLDSLAITAGQTVNINSATITHA